MKVFVPKEKLSKKSKRELDRQARKDWRGISPVTRRPASAKAYSRRKARKIDEDFTDFSHMK